MKQITYFIEGLKEVKDIMLGDPGGYNDNRIRWTPQTRIAHAVDEALEGTAYSNKFYSENNNGVGPRYMRVREARNAEVKHKVTLATGGTEAQDRVELPRLIKLGDQLEDVLYNKLGIDYSLNY